MKMILIILFWPFKAIWFLILGVILFFIMSYSVAYNALFTKREEELDVDAESSVSDVIDEDADNIRRWLYQDAGLEEIGDEVKKAFARQSFEPIRPFVPYWRIRR